MVYWLYFEFFLALKWHPGNYDTIIAIVFALSPIIYIYITFFTAIFVHSSEFELF